MKVQGCCLEEFTKRSEWEYVSADNGFVIVHCSGYNDCFLAANPSRRDEWDGSHIFQSIDHKVCHSQCSVDMTSLALKLCMR